MSVLAFLNTPYPHEVQPKAILRVAIYIGAIVGIVLLFFGPTSASVSWAIKARLALEYALITSIMTLVIGLVALGLQVDWYREEKWTVGKEILMFMVHISLISAANLVYTRLAYAAFAKDTPYVEWLINTAIIGIVPVFVSIIINMIRLRARHEQDALELHQELEQPLRATPLIGQPKRIIGDNQNEWLDLKSEQFLFAEAADNYVAIHYLRSENGINGAPSANFLLRYTLKSLSVQLGDWPDVIACHRSYLVNLRQVTEVAGNAAGLRLQLANGLAEVPVSRSYIPEVKQHLAQLH